MKLKPISPLAQDEFAKYENLRENFTSEGHFLNLFLWQHYYRTEYAADEQALYLVFHKNERHGAFPPLCRDEALPAAFLQLETYFHQTLGTKLRLYLADQNTVNQLRCAGCLDHYEILPDRDSFDYIYDAEKMRTLSGRTLHKKKNLLNGFLREYEGRFQYETLHCSDMEEVKEFHQKWLLERRIYDKYHSIDDEEEGICRLFENCDKIACRLGGVRIDGELKAYTIGSYIPDIQCAMIHIEKADVNYRGLYNYINRQFLICEFPEAIYVNREDDLGQENLRQAKLSYRPMRLEEKFSILER